VGRQDEPARDQLHARGQHRRRDVASHRVVGPGQHFAARLDRHLLHPAEPLGHVRQQKLGVDVEQPLEQ
jgi:hypothetical protein